MYFFLTSVIRRRWHQLTYRNFNMRMQVMMNSTLLNAMYHFSMREPGNRRYWASPRPQAWFDTFLTNRDLDW